MADFARLVLAADATGLDKGKAALDRLTVSAMKAEDQAQDTALAAKRLSVATGAMGTAAVSAGVNMRGITQQLSQVGQQTMATGNFVQALAIQLPDIGLAFGAVGTAAGLLAGIALPMVMSAFGGTKSAAEQLADTLDQISDSASALRGAYDALGSAQDGYVKAVQSGNYVLAESYRTLIALQEEALSLQKQQTMADIATQQAALDALTATVEEAQAAVDSFNAAGSRRTNATQGGIFDVDAYAAAAAALAEARRQADLVANALDVSRNKADILAQESAIASEEIATATANANGLSAGLSGAAARAGGLLGTLISVANAAWSAAAALDAGAALNNALGPDERGSQRAQTDMTQSGIGAARAAEGMAQATRNAAAYAQALSGVQTSAGGAAGALGDVYDIQDALNDILKDASDPVKDMQDAMGSLADSVANDLGSAFTNFIESGGSDWDQFADDLVGTFADAMAQVVADFIENQMIMAGMSFGGPVGAVIGAIAGSLISGLFSGGGSSDDWQTQYNLRTKELELMGETELARKRELALMSEDEQAIQVRIWALEDEQAIMEERAGLEQQLLTLQGDTAALRALELNALDDSNKALQEQIWALEDQQAAAEEAAQAAEEAAAAQDAIDQERYDLETQLLTLQGKTAELRARELEQLDPTNRALQEMIWGLEDAQAAMEALNENDFASLFQFNKAQADALGGFTANANAAPYNVPTTQVSVTSPDVLEIQKTNSLLGDVRTLLTTISGYEKTTRDVLQAAQSGKAPLVTEAA